MFANKTVYLTIDDSPSRDFIDKINFLDKHNIPAVIFGIGNKMEGKPEEIIEAIKKGFLIGNHSYSHPHFSKITLQKAEKEILRTDKIIDELYKKANKHRPVKLFRFPYGDKGWNKQTESIFVKLLPGRIQKVFNRFSGSKHKEKIQQYLKDMNYIHPKYEDVTYPFYKKDLNLMEENDMYWTFDFREYKKDSIDDIYEHMEKKQQYDKINGRNYKVGSLMDDSSNDILLIHDHEETSHLFYEILDKCIKSDLRFSLKC